MHDPRKELQEKRDAELAEVLIFLEAAMIASGTGGMTYLQRALIAETFVLGWEKRGQVDA